MLRRGAAIVGLAALAVALGLPLLRAAWSGAPAGPRAVRLVSVSGNRITGPWQAWADAALVPTVAGRVTLRRTGCPGLPRAAGCVYTRQPRVVYVHRDARQPRAVMLHELGHVYDLTVLSNRDRGAFRRIMRRPHARWWEGRIALAEWFAEAYSWCARHARVSVERYAIYSYDPTPAQHRATCSLIKRAARDRTPPAPAPSPPVVTGDPAPPAAPPVAPTVVPGDPVRDPGPAPAENANAVVTPMPAASPLSTIIPIPAIRLPLSTPIATTTASPDHEPTQMPTAEPSPEPTADPTETPTVTPTPEPTPTETPTPEPTPTVR